MKTTVILSFILACSLGLFSCATLIHTKEYPLKVTANMPGTRVQHGNNKYTLPAKISIRRADTPVTFVVSQGTVQKVLTLQPSHNKMYMQGNLLGPCMPLIGYVADRFSNKRFYYGTKFHVDLSDTTSVIETGYQAFYKRPWKKGLSLFFSIPYANNLYQQPIGYGAKLSTGFWGISAGFDYTYKQNKFLQFSAGTALDFPLPVLGPLDRFGYFEDMKASYFSVTDNVKYGPFIIGYGLHYTQNRWQAHYRNDYVDSLNNTTLDIARTSRTIGLTGNVYWNFGRNFNVGIMYMPSLYSVSSPQQFIYQHLLSLDFRWRFPLQSQKPSKGHYSVL